MIHCLVTGEGEIGGSESDRTLIFTGSRSVERSSTVKSGAEIGERAPEIEISRKGGSVPNIL